ncbi:MAG: GTP 3',8-cyclase MoaA, partial [Deltaproteobacteria bacterium]|nr:GTP 3',8-cyclase MoaA [Deltaproteobacteria bacterium]MBI4224366.1 GTP 3',8-cyclase MoaA [Deltaproteobacteria bacterium]
MRMRPLLKDNYHRVLDYLRISVTDRCNFRCIYCLPPEGIPLSPKQDILTLEEIARVARVFLAMGGSKIRLTGGEPLMRKNIVGLVAELSRLPGLQTLGLTTNGYHLKKLAKPLREAGLEQVNVSLDSLAPSRFAKLTHCDQFERIWEAIEISLLAGLQVKINVVALKGITQEEVLGFANLAKHLPLEVRFIEFMPLCGTGWHPEWMIPLREIRRWIAQAYALEELPRGAQVAQSFSLKAGRGRIGFIASMSEPFCENCSRLRLTANGTLRPCLFSEEAVDLKP